MENQVTLHRYSFDTPGCGIFTAGSVRTHFGWIYGYVKVELLSLDLSCAYTLWREVVALFAYKEKYHHKQFS